VTSPQNDLLDGIAQLIVSNSLATYRTDGTDYLDSETGIVFKAVNPKPDRIITMTAYQVSDNPTMPESRLGVQLRFRGTQDPRDVDDLGDSVYSILHGLTGVWFNSVFAEQVLRQSSITLGQDAAKRWERADAYYVDAGLPPTSNRPTGGSW
jgi:hypothetical protein